MSDMARNENSASKIPRVSDKKFVLREECGTRIDDARSRPPEYDERGAAALVGGKNPEFATHY